MAEDFLRRDEVAAFWDDARRRASPDQQTGYLTDAWPAAVGANRFAGELARVDRWLAGDGVRRGRCLDVGCGTGVWLEQLARRFDRADGLDLSAEMVASANQRLAAAGITNASAAHGAIADLPGDAGYDLIFVGGVLMYVDDAALDGAIAGLVGRLAPGGVIILRESTCTGRTRYRDRPLSPGLFDRADRANRTDRDVAPRPAYRAIYRPRACYRDALIRHGLALLALRVNRGYLLADVSAAVLLGLDRVTFGALARRRPRAERAAIWLHRLRAIVLWPALLVRPLIPPWRIANHWFVARRPAIETARLDRDAGTA